MPDYDQTFLEDYISDTINNAGELQKKLENYVEENKTPELFKKAEPFLAERVEVLSSHYWGLKPMSY